MVAEVIDNTTSRGRTLRFLHDGTHTMSLKRLYLVLERLRFQKQLTVRLNLKTEIDTKRFMQNMRVLLLLQTAGMHFSRELMKRLEIIGVDFAEITLHVGLGNFRSVDVEDLTKHKMDSEQIFITEKACDIINSGKDAKKRICAVGDYSYENN